MKSILYRLNGNDVVKGLVVAVLGALLGIFQQMLTEHGLEFGLYDWGQIMNIAVTSGIAYISKNFLSDNEGKVLGSI